MKKQVSIALVMLSLIVTLAVTSANAQSRTHFIRITIPFEFIVKGETLPAGVYTVKRASADKPEMLLLSGANGDPGVYVVTVNVRSSTRQSASKLVFNQYGKRYFLSQVWEDGDNQGRQLLMSRDERATGLQLAKDSMKRHTVTLIAIRR